jgi:hypothetical protein
LGGRFAGQTGRCGCWFASRRVARTIGVSAQEVAAFLDVSKGVASYEDGTVRVAASALIELCRFFCVKLEELFPNYDRGRYPKLN